MSFAGSIAHYGLPALFLGGGIEGETVVVVGGILAHKGLVSLPGAMAATAAGSFVADQILFAIGRRAADWRLVQRLKRNPIYARALAMLERYPIGFIFAFRFIPGFRTVSPFAIGTSGVSARLFLAVNAVAAVIWASTFTVVGYVFGREAEKMLGRIEPSPTTIAIGAALVVVVGVAIHYGVKWWRGRDVA